jgi:S-adenosylmethionine hydrolase
LPLIVEIGQRRFVGPDNGLLSRLAGDRRFSRIDWQPSALSNTFHGRDLFAPVGARLAARLPVAATPLSASGRVGVDWPDVLERVIYIDDFGNVVLGIPAQGIDPNGRILVSGQSLAFAPRFGAVPLGTPFWYRNSLDLVEIAVNGGSAATRLSLAIGDAVLIQ